MQDMRLNPGLTPGALSLSVCLSLYVWYYPICLRSLFLSFWKEFFLEDDMNANMKSKSLSAVSQKAFEKSYLVIYLPNKWPLQHNMSVEWIISLQHSLEMDLSEQYQRLSISQVNERENESREWTLPQGTQWKWKPKRQKWIRSPVST